MSRYRPHSRSYSRGSYTDDDDLSLLSNDIDIRVKHHHPSPHRAAAAPVHYVEARSPPSPSRPRFYSTSGGGRLDDPRFLVPAANERTVVTTRRSRSRGDRRSSSPGVRAPLPAPAAPPVIIHNNQIYNNSDSESDTDYSHSHSHFHSHSRSRASGHRHHRSHSHSRSRSRASSSGYSRDRNGGNGGGSSSSDRYALEHMRRDYERDAEASRQAYELERAQKELEEMRLVSQIERDEQRRDRSLREERELREAKKELEEVRARKEREEQERRLKQKLDLERLREEEAALAEKRRRDKEAKEAVEKYKKEEAERQLREKEEAEEREREYRHKMQDQLLKSGLDEKEINAILSGKKIQKEKEKDKDKDKEREREKDRYLVDLRQPVPQQEPMVQARPTYTRMARRHLSIETLRAYNIDYQVDMDPHYVLIKRLVSEPEQDVLWQHTRILREHRSSGGERKLIMAIEDKERRKHLEPEFEWVRKKERRRSRSPSLLTYLAGGRPG